MKINMLLLNSQYCHNIVNKKELYLLTCLLPTSYISLYHYHTIYLPNVDFVPQILNKK